MSCDYLLLPLHGEVTPLSVVHNNVFYFGYGLRANLTALAPNPQRFQTEDIEFLGHAVENVGQLLICQRAVLNDYISQQLVLEESSERLAVDVMEVVEVADVQGLVVYEVQRIRVRVQVPERGGVQVLSLAGDQVTAEVVAALECLKRYMPEIQ